MDFSEQQEAVLIDEQITVLHFDIESLHCCIELKYIDRVVPIASLQQLPSDSQAIAGLLNLNGEGLPVLDLAYALGVSSNTIYAMDAMYLICEHNRGHESSPVRSDTGYESTKSRFGLVTSKVHGVARHSKSFFQLEADFKKSSQPFISTINTEYGMSYLLDMASVKTLLVPARE